MNIPVKSPAAPSVATSGANTYSDLNALSSLKKDPSSPQSIRAVAQQIDAMFLQMMLKSMRDASAEVGEAASNEMGMYQDMFDKQISLSLSQNPSLGLGAQLTRQLGGGSTAAPPAAAALVPAGGTATAIAARAAGMATAAAAQEAEAPEDFVAQVFPSIQRAAQALGINPFAMLAQAVLETGWGRRMARTADGAPSHNLFGIKADDGWAGARVTADTIEFSGGVATQRRTAFRAYGSAEDSVADFARLLASSPRYRDAIAAGGGAGAYVEAIGKSGYATDPRYADKLNEILQSSTFRTALKSQRILL